MIGKRLKSVFKKRADNKREALQNKEIAILQPFVSELIEKLDPAKIANPLHHMNLAFELFMTAPSKLNTIKWKETEDLFFLRFSRMLKEFQRGSSPISAQHALEILGVSGRRRSGGRRRQVRRG